MFGIAVRIGIANTLGLTFILLPVLNNSVGMSLITEDWTGMGWNGMEQYRIVKIQDKHLTLMAILHYRMLCYRLLMLYF